MPTYTTTANDIINAVIQDGQVQTTNRTALLDYVNRTHLRILRETQWTFLQSGYKKFITKTGVDKYWIGPGAAPNGYANTGLNLSDAESVLPDSVYDLTNAVGLTQDSSQIRFSRPFLFKDGTTHWGRPRGYAYYQREPYVMHMFPPPDNQNTYYPIPEPSLCQNITGGVLPGRNYWVQTTFVDSAGGEGTASLAFSQTVAADSLLMVSSPEFEVPSALSPKYLFWNVYISGSEGGPFFKQNVSPIPIGSPWIEPVAGANPVAPLSQEVLIASSTSSLYSMTVDSSGILHSVSANLQYNPFSVYLLDSYGQVYTLGVLDSGDLTSTLVPFAQASSNLILADNAGGAWKVSIDSAGHLMTTSIGPASGYVVRSVSPPSTPTLAPLEGYVIAFRYQKVKQLITSVDDVLQVPDAYSDVVVAGVNYYASLYLAKGDDENIKAPIWKREFTDGMAQIRRDLRINYRNTDFISPDRTTQYDATKAVWIWNL